MQKEHEKTEYIGEGKSVPPHTPARFLWYVSRRYKWWMFTALAVTVIAAALSQASYYFLKLIIDAVEGGNLERALLFGLVYPAFVFCVQLLFRVSGYTAMQWVLNARRTAYERLVGYVLYHSHGYYSDRFGGSVLSKVSNVVDATEQFIVDFLWTHLSSFVAFLVTFGFIWMVDPLSSGIFVALVVVLIVVNRAFAPKKRILSRAAAENASELRGFIVDLFTNAAAVRQYAHARGEMSALGGYTTRHQTASRNNWLYTELMLLVNVAILFVCTFALFYVLILRWDAGDISLGDFILVLSLIADLSGTLTFIGRAINSTARAVGEAEEGLDDLLVPHEIEDAPGARTLEVGGGKIEWQNVSFAFAGNQVFKEFNLTIPAGQRVGLVGSSGAGKSTFVSLLLRQHDVNGGTISIDGQDIAMVTQDSLRKNIAVVPQEPLLFHRSIRENIAYGKPEATEKDIIEAARQAQAHDFIVALPDGYETLVGERGVKLSGGQRQRIAIARAMLKHAPLLVLDEATSALDSESEVAIQKALHILMEDKTVIAIAHRLSTLREMDRILVLDNGRVVEDGTHNELVKNGGLYASLWTHQAGGFLQE